MSVNMLKRVTVLPQFSSSFIVEKASVANRRKYVNLLSQKTNISCNDMA